MVKNVQKVLFSVREGEKYNFKEGYYFPEFAWDDSTLYNGINVISKKKIKHESFPLKKEFFCWEIHFSTPIRVDLDSTELNQKIFIQNSNKYTIYFHSTKNKKWYKKDYTVNFEKYQFPDVVKLDEWHEIRNDQLSDNSDISKRLVSNSDKINFIDHLVLIVHPQKKFKRRDFVVGEFKLYNSKRSFTTQVYHPFFALYNGEGYKEKPGFKKMSDLYFRTVFPLSNEIRICFENDTIDNKSIIRLFQLIFERYPYYQIYGRSKHEILKEIEILSQNESIKSDTLLSSLQKIVRSLKDPHFKMFCLKKEGGNQKSITQTRRKEPGPIRLYNMYDKILVSAVLDTSSLLKPGMEVISIDEIPICHLIDSIAENYSGCLSSRRKKALSKSLYRYDNETSTIQAFHNNDTVTTQLTYDKSYPIPNRFKNNDYTVKKIDKKTTYIRIPSWDQKLYTNILNDSEKIIMSENIIIDLRNNSGGGFEERLASMFIKQPEIYYHFWFPWKEESIIKRTFILQPNNQINLSDKKVVILINKGTICASELFCEFMRKKNNAIIIGSEKSPGAYSPMLSIDLPKGYILGTSLSENAIMTSGRNIEGSGIEPDIWISLTKVEDLAPYQDKVLKAAVLYLKNQIKKTGQSL